MNSGNTSRETSPSAFGRLADLVLDPIDMIRSLRREADPWLNFWGPSLILPQAVGGLVFFGRIEGAVVLGGLISMLVTAGYIHRHAPLSRLTGICQAWWFLTLPWLAERAIDQDTVSVFSVWLWYTVVTMAISIVMDVYGVHLYLTTDNRTYRRDAP